MKSKSRIEEMAKVKTVSETVYLGDDKSCPIGTVTITYNNHIVLDSISEDVLYHAAVDFAEKVAESLPTRDEEN